jgi:tripartite-type tricarboxylate transporter receptor subunit TctC
MFALTFRQPGKIFAAALVATVALSCAAQRAAAQAYPTRPVTVIVPFAAGGGNDILLPTRATQPVDELANIKSDNAISRLG